MKQAKTKKPIKAITEIKKQSQPKTQNKKEKKLRVLILEDNLADAELMERQLKKTGIGLIAQQVDTRSGFLKTLQAFKPDLILADYKLPKFDALQALKLSQKSAPQIPFIIVTGAISEETAVECMKQGADDYLLKDRLARLGEAVKQAMKKRRLQAEKARTEAKLQSNESLYRTFIDSSTDMIFLKDDRFRHLLANQALSRFYGKVENEIFGKTDFELMDKSVAAKCRRSDKQALAETGIHVSEEAIGGLIFETRKFPVKLINGRIGVGGYIRDISERKYAEDALRKSEEQYRDLVEKGNIAIAVDDKDGRLVYFNNQFINLFGYSAGEIEGKTHKDFLHPDSLKIVSNYHQKRVHNEKAPSRYEFKGIRKDGSTINVEIDVCEIIKKEGKASGTRSYMWDITKRKKIEDALIDSENRYRNLFENSSEFYFTLDLKGNFIDVNQAAVTLTGHAKSELLKMNFKDYTPKSDHRKLFLTLANIYKTGKPVQNFLVEATIKNQSKKYFETSFSLMKKGEQIIGFQGSSKDITERKHAEEQIHASLLEKEVLLKEIHHRVKNNLQIISGLLTLQAAQINDERLQRVLKESQGRIWTMALIHQTLYQSGNLADIDMADYIRSLAGNLLSSHARIAMPPTLSFDLLTLRLVVDKAIPLALIINELLTNALKHAFPDGRPGEIRITLHEYRGAEFCVPTEDTGTAPCRGTARRAPTEQDNAPSYELTVADNGVGLPAGFDPNNQKSLGLQLVAMLVKQLGGALVSESKGGTSVTLTFYSNEKN